MTQKISQDQINPDTKLGDLFPYYNRRQKVKEFESYLGTDINILTYPGWLALTFVVRFLLSLLALFFDWQIALAGIVLFISAINIADKLGKKIDLQTVRELTEKLSRERHIDIRRARDNINRQEISQIIINTFSNDLAINKVYLSWTFAIYKIADELNKMK